MARRMRWVMSGCSRSSSAEVERGQRTGVHLADGDDAGRALATIDHADLAERRPVAERGDVLAVGVDRDGAVQDDEEAAGRIAFGEDLGPVREVVLAAARRRRWPVVVRSTRRTARPRRAPRSAGWVASSPSWSSRRNRVSALKLLALAAPPSRGTGRPCRSGCQPARLTSSHSASSVARSDAWRSMPRSRASASTCSNRPRNLCAAARNAASGSIFRWRATLTTANSRSPSSSSTCGGVAAAHGLDQLGGLLGDLRQRPVDVGPVEAELGGLALHGIGVHQRRLRHRHAVEHRRALLLLALDRVPVAQHRGGVVGVRRRRTRAGGGGRACRARHGRRRPS